MKKLGAFLTIFLTAILITSFSLAQSNQTNSTAPDNEKSDSQQIADGYACLEEKAGPDCSSLSTNELALTILATPENIFDECVTELKSRKSSDNWGNVKDTALSIMAMKHAGEDTKAAEDWLLTKEQIPKDLVWYLEPDSNKPTECDIGYDANNYLITIGENKKIDKDAGPCLETAQANFWLKVSPSCYNTEFKIKCDEDYINALLYKNKNSPTIYVLGGTQSAPAFGETKTSVTSKCFGDTDNCDYEASAWATLALLESGYNIEDYIPYLTALSSSNENYLPNAFLYILTNYEDYAAQLIEDQQLSNFWLAKNSANDKFYDTALSIISLGSSSSKQIEAAKNQLLFSQSKSTGCWQNSVKDTAIVLWALTGKSGKASGGSSVTTCGEANYFCIPSSDCPSNEVLGNYFCPSLSTTCCEKENLLTCDEYQGTSCNSDEVCDGGIEKKSSDEVSCCTGTCEPKPQETECESKSYSCSSSCSSSQEEKSLDCDGPKVCCGAPTGSSDGGSGLVWFFTIGILILLGALGWFFRERLKMEWFKIKTKFKKDKGGTSSSGSPRKPGIPPRPMARPGYAPLRRMQQRPVRASVAGTREMSDTFRKLKEMSK